MTIGLSGLTITLSRECDLYSLEILPRAKCEGETMFQDLDSRLMLINEKIRHRRKLRADLETSRKMLDEQQARLCDLKAILDKEKVDVEKLEGLGLASLFHAVLGDKNARLEKEKQEYLAAKLKYDDAEYAVSALDRDIEATTEKIAALDDVDAQHREILAEKERMISQQGGDTAQELASLSEQAAALRADITELNEAIAAGKAAMEGLDRVIDSLQSAKNWGTVDMIGGGLIATAVKHSKLDSAKNCIHQLQHALRNFQRELADVGAATDLKVHIGSFATFADYFFDGLIVDWMVQSRINNSLDTALDARSRIQSVLHDLNTGLHAVQTKSEEIEQQKRQIIEKA